MKGRRAIRLQCRSDPGSVGEKKEVGESMLDFTLVLRKSGKVTRKSWSQKISVRRYLLGTSLPERPWLAVFAWKQPIGNMTLAQMQ